MGVSLCFAASCGKPVVKNVINRKTRGDWRWILSGYGHSLQTLTKATPLRGGSLLVYLVVVSLALVGCATSNLEGPQKTAQLYAQDGMAAFEAGKYNEALDDFQQLKNWYPFSKYAILAELKIADANYNLKQYPEAVSAYEDFERLHPRNEAIPYVIYQIGRCYFEQIDTIDRDQTSAQKALETFRRLVSQFPQDAHSQTARPLIITCLQSIMAHDFYVGQFYFKAKDYDAALHRFNAIVSEYPDVGWHRPALLAMAKCRAYLGEKEQRRVLE